VKSVVISFPVLHDAVATLIESVRYTVEKLAVGQKLARSLVDPGSHDPLTDLRVPIVLRLVVERLSQSTVKLKIYDSGNRSIPELPGLAGPFMKLKSGTVATGGSTGSVGVSWHATASSAAQARTIGIRARMRHLLCRGESPGRAPELPPGREGRTGAIDRTDNDSPERMGSDVTAA
jgi:hypothetical protein